MTRHLLPICWLTGTLAAQAILPPPPTPAANKVTAGKAMLGQALFWDEQLSSSNGMACGSCHILSYDGTDPRAPHSVHPGPDGVFGNADDVHGSPGVPRHDRDSNLLADRTFGVQWQVSARRAPPIINAAYAESLFVDGRADSVFVDPITGAVVLPTAAALEHQLLEPPVSATEMGHINRTWPDVARHLGPLTPLAIADRLPATLHRFVTGHTYGTLFAQVFGTPGITPTRIAFAIASYERTLISDQSPYDKFLAGQGTLTSQQHRGLRLFESLCADCHTDLDRSVLTTGLPTGDFRNTGVRPPKEDIGRAAVTGRDTDVGRFRVPGLRNVALRSSYFHNGRFTTLRDVLDFYARGGDFADNRDPLVTALAGRISPSDKTALLALLHTLTDPRVAAELPPFDRPRLWLEGPLLPTAFGTGTAGTLPLPPRISALGTAYLGSDVFSVGIDQIAPQLFTALLVDLVPAATPTQLFGVEMYLGQSPALLSLAMGMSEPGQNGQGYKSHVFHVPPAAASPGTYWLQWVVLDPGAPQGFAASNGMRMLVQ